MRSVVVNRKISRRGFSLMELMLVVVIIAILGAVVAPLIMGGQDKAKVSAAIANIESFKTALDNFRRDVGRYPEENEGLQALTENSANLKKWDGPYMPKIPKDPWEQDFQYRKPQVKSKLGYDVWSKGPDEKDGTDDDIGNW